ncbi:hypothetical protein DICPUDRAFT_158432 [Dictyostelium purpureum]|uniref:Uncharacterized protein n=1 Tax=Dictyostelium purpureum TaxID=5786 RepID=F1A1L6_DICPU|nr:uncharacterized protein DICPUDRAFT_158432 [Dictyostelium purpureum]EGC29914.1 hypothetical protein DICPUDRAFT_158432 [Dictyostelium purpureum]|eukprot:XP_003293555.1 hypothetical protein DICPUDRAFT_158432 [Dictyostelium purpureum]
MKPFINKSKTINNYSLIRLENSIGVYDAPKEPYPIIYDSYGKDVNNDSINQYRKILLTNLDWDGSFPPLNPTDEWYPKTKVCFEVTPKTIHKYYDVFDQNIVYQVNANSDITQDSKQDFMNQLIHLGAKRIIYSDTHKTYNISALLNNNTLKYIVIKRPIEPKDLAELNNDITVLKSIDFIMDLGKVITLRAQSSENWSQMVEKLSNNKTIKEFKLLLAGKSQIKKRDPISRGFKKILTSPTCPIKTLCLEGFGFVDGIFLDALSQNKTISTLSLINTKNIDQIITQVLPINKRIRNLTLSSHNAKISNIDILKLIQIKQKDIDLYSLTLHSIENGEYNNIINYLSSNQLPIKEINIQRGFFNADADGPEVEADADGAEADTGADDADTDADANGADADGADADGSDAGGSDANDTDSDADGADTDEAGAYDADTDADGAEADAYGAEADAYGAEADADGAEAEADADGVNCTVKSLLIGCPVSN